MTVYQWVGPDKVAQAFFHRDWNQWMIGIYRRDRGGCAEAYVDGGGSQVEAERLAAIMNRQSVVTGNHWD